MRDSSLASILLLDYLDRDTRPTFIVGTGTACNLASLLYENPAFEPVRQAGLLSQDEAFLTWLRAAEDVDASESYHGQDGNGQIIWSRVIIQSYIIINGVRLAPRTVPADPEPKEAKHRETSSGTARSGHDHGSTKPRALLMNLDRTLDRASTLPKGFSWQEHCPEHAKTFSQVRWEQTPLGPIHTWSPELQMMTNFTMTSPEPSVLFWGEDLTSIYNEPYVRIMAGNHPGMLGSSPAQYYPEVWDYFKLLFDRGYDTGQATQQQHVPFMVSSGRIRPEECYFSFSHVPVLGADGSVLGFHQYITEDTRDVLTQRRMSVLLEVGRLLSDARSLKSFFATALRGLSTTAGDIVFAVIYSVRDGIIQSCSTHTEDNMSKLKAEDAIGFANQADMKGSFYDPSHPAQGFGPMLQSAIEKVETVTFEVDDKMATLLAAASSDGKAPCKSGVAVPLCLAGNPQPASILVLGIHPQRIYDEDFERFTTLYTRLLTTALESALSYEQDIGKDKQRAEDAVARQERLEDLLESKIQELARSERKFREIAEHAPVGIVVLSSDGDINYANERWYEIFAHPRDAAAPMSFMDYVHPEDQEYVGEVWQKICTTREPITLEFRLEGGSSIGSSSEGSDSDCERWALASAYVEPVENGYTVVSSVTKITEQKKAEEVLRKRMVETLETKRQQEAFMDMTSHEIRNPLSAILQCADAVEKIGLKVLDETSLSLPKELKAEYEEILDHAKLIGICAQHQKRILDDVLCLSKLDSDLVEITPISVQPMQVVSNVLKIFRVDLDQHDIKVIVKKNESMDTLHIDWLRLDPSRLSQILINLIGNGIKFTRARELRTITITLGASLVKPESFSSSSAAYLSPLRPGRALFDGMDWGTGEIIFLELSVTDSGSGLTSAEKDHIFKRFGQASRRTHVDYGGSGLGLFISKQLVEMHGGQIGFDSQFDQGSIFAFFLLTRRCESDDREQVKKAGVETASYPNSGGHRRREHLSILVVEDNLVNQKLLAKQLSKLGHKVHTANHGGEALDFLRQTNVWSGNADGLELDMVLMDQEMPVMDGNTCVREIRHLESDKQISCHLPIIAITANVREMHVRDAVEAGVDDFVGKPFSVQELMTKVDQLLSKSENIARTRD